jgi:hypothetical protein
MIHNVHLIRRKLAGKSNAHLIPLVVLSFGLLAMGLIMFFNQ